MLDLQNIAGKTVLRVYATPSSLRCLFELSLWESENFVKYLAQIFAWSQRPVPVEKAYLVGEPVKVGNVIRFQGPYKQSTFRRRRDGTHTGPCSYPDTREQGNRHGSLEQRV